MKPTRAVLFVLANLLAAACSGPPAESSAPAPEPASTVAVAAVARRQITEEIPLYGSVVSGPEARHTASVPFEGVVRRIRVRVGEQVATGAPVIDIDPSPDARLAVEQARTETDAAAAALTFVQGRFSSRLATREEVSQAQRNARDAELRLRSMLRRGASALSEIASPGPAVVAAIHVSEGALVAPGAPLVDLDLRAHREARFGIEPEDNHLVAVGASVLIADLSLPARAQLSGAVRAIGDAVDPSTGLVDMYASIPDGNGFMLGQRVSGSLPVTSDPVLVVPRAALVPMEDRMVVFVVAGDHVREQVVQVGLETDDEVEITSEGVTEGDTVVVMGAASLRDGMRVRVEAP